MAQNKSFYNIGDLFKNPPIVKIKISKKGTGRKYAKKSHENKSSKKGKERG